MDNLLKQFAQSSQLAGGNASYVEDLYEQYLVSPDSVDPKWKTYFDGFKGREAGDIPHSAVISHIADAAKDALGWVAEHWGIRWTYALGLPLVLLSAALDRSAGPQSDALCAQLQRAGVACRADADRSAPEADPPD